MLRESEMSTRGRPEVVDQLAAVLILQSFLEFRRSQRARNNIVFQELCKRHGESYLHLNCSFDANLFHTRSFGDPRICGLVYLGGATAGHACSRRPSCCCGRVGRPSTSPNELQNDGVIRSARAFLMLHYAQGLGSLKAGEYKFEDPATRRKYAAAF